MATVSIERREGAAEARDERARVAALVHRYGHNTTSFQVLSDGYRYAFFGDDACVAYVDTGGAWVAAGAPLAPRERIAEVAMAFVVRAREAHRRAAFFATEQRFVEGAAAFRALPIGEQPVWDPGAWRATLGKVRSLREQVRRARAKKVRSVRLEGDELSPGGKTRSAVETLVARWQSARPMAPMGFVVQVTPFVQAADRRTYAALREGALVGFLSLAPVYARGGFFFENLLRDPSAPSGTMELLFDHAMRDLEADGFAYATFGLAPLAGDVAPWLRVARRLGRPLYDFVGLHAFKRKLRPARFDPVYLSIPREASAVFAIYDVLRAFARRPLVLFGLATVLRGPDVALRALAVLLVPWTTVLALAGARWFPSRDVQLGWVAFDVVIALLLGLLVIRWRSGLATVLAAAVTADAILTSFEALAWNAPRLHGPLDALVVAGATFAPLFAAVVLWNARARRRLLARPILV